MYNETYIQEFSEKEYINVLSSRSKLLSLIDAATNQYTDQSNANSLAFKESLDHYIKKRLLTDNSFIDSPYFKNYLAYIFKVLNKKTLKATDKYNIYPELITNPIFRDEKLRSLIFQKYLTDEQKKEYEKRHNTAKEIINIIFDAMAKNQALNSNLINIAADYIYSSRDVSGDKGDIFAKYILNNAKKFNISSSIAIIGAITTIITSNFTLDEEARNSRFFIANYDKNQKVGIAHSSFNHRYCVFSKSIAEKISLSSYESLFSSRTQKQKDIYWIIFVCFHELTHQHQKLDCLKGKLTSSGISYTIRNILNQMMPTNTINGQTIYDYTINHDSDEIEMEADEEGWIQTRKFIHKMISLENRIFTDNHGKQQDMWVLALDNILAIQARRTFTVKKDTNTFVQEKQGKTTEQTSGKYYALYDLINLIKIIKKTPTILDSYPILKNFFNPDGSMKTIDILSMDIYQKKSGDIITSNNSNNAGLEIGTFVLMYKWEDVIKDVQNGKIRDIRQINKIFNNIYNIIHESVLKVRNFNRIAFDNNHQLKYNLINPEQYAETKTRFDLTNQSLIKRLYNHYFKNVVIGVIRFYEFKTMIEEKYHITLDNKFSGDFKRYIYEMYCSLIDKDDISCMQTLEQLRKTNHPDLIQVYDLIIQTKEKEKSSKRQ